MDRILVRGSEHVARVYAMSLDKLSCGFVDPSPVEDRLHCLENALRAGCCGDASSLLTLDHNIDNSFDFDRRQFFGILNFFDSGVAVLSNRGKLRI